VDNHAANEILQQIYDVEISDGFSYAGKQTAVNDGFRFFNTLFYGTKLTYQVALQTPEGTKKTVMLWEKATEKDKETTEKSKKDTITDNSNRQEDTSKLLFKKPTWLLHESSQRLRIDEKYAKLAILQIASFDNRRFSKFYRKAFQLLKDHQITHLVIDLRNNGGGKVQDANELMTYLLDKPFTYHFERKKQKLKGLLQYSQQGKFWLRITPAIFRFFATTQQDSNVIYHTWHHKAKQYLQFKGKVFVLTNGGTFSAAATVASYLKNLSNSTLIGTETGGSEAGTNALLFPLITLPNSKIQVRIPLYYVKYAIGIPDNRRGVLPHFCTQYTLQDVLDRKDLEMEEVYKGVGNGE
ncbi:MAG: S41 family peptidase, partial [Thermoflexibacteraceae bacterium]